MRKVILLCLLPAFVWAQQYFEASGQTRVFTLKAGVKAGPSAVLPGSRLVHAKGLALSISGTHITVEGVRCPARLSVYNLSGRLIQSAALNGRSSVVLRSDLPNGVYFARLETNSGVLQTVRFWKAR